MKNLQATPAALDEAAPSQTSLKSLFGTGVLAALVAAAATTAVAAVAKAAGVGFEVDGEEILTVGFAELTLVFSLLGVVLAAILARTVRHPRSVFVRTTVVLVVLSLVPDVTFGFDLPSAVMLMVCHVIAAAIVIPAAASRLPARRQR